MMHTNDKAVAALNDLIGRRVALVYCGPAGGAVLDIHFGPTMRRKRPLTSPDLCADERELQGERSLFVECSWRFRRDEILCGSGDSLNDSDRIYEPITSLVGATLCRISLVEGGGVLEPSLEFDDGSTLRVFPDTSFHPDDNLTVFVGDDSVPFYGPRSIG